MQPKMLGGQIEIPCQGETCPLSWGWKGLDLYNRDESPQGMGNLARACRDLSGQKADGAYLKIYGNRIALKAAREGKHMPYRAIVVKETYGKDKKTPMAITPIFRL